MLAQLKNELQNQVVEIGGVDVATDACDRMYQASFRSEPIAIDFDDDFLVDALITDYKKSIVFKAHGLVEEPNFDGDEGRAEYFWGLVEDCADNKTVLDAIKVNPYYVDICNYKGEGETVALLVSAVNLPVFKSKSQSFYQAQ